MGGRDRQISEFKARLDYRAIQRNPIWKNNNNNKERKTPNVLSKDRILKALREKCQVTNKGRPIRIIPDFLPETMKARSFWVNVMQTMREHKCQPRLPYPAKLPITINGENKIFHDKTKYTH